MVERHRTYWSVRYKIPEVPVHGMDFGTGGVVRRHIVVGSGLSDGRLLVSNLKTDYDVSIGVFTRLQRVGIQKPD